MRPLVLATMALSTLALASLQGAHAALETDGVTAQLVLNAPGALNTVFAPNAAGNYAVKVTLFQKLGARWDQVAQNATLRISTAADNSAATGDPTPHVYARLKMTPSGQLIADAKSPSGSAHGRAHAGFQERLAIPFLAQKGGTIIEFPAAALGNPEGTGSTSLFDLSVEFSSPTGAVSHHSEAKNRLIFLQRFDDADALDATSVPVVGV